MGGEEWLGQWQAGWAPCPLKAQRAHRTLQPAPTGLPRLGPAAPQTFAPFCPACRRQVQLAARPEGCAVAAAGRRGHALLRGHGDTVGGQGGCS